MATPLARITGPMDAPRGPDVTHRVGVSRDWLVQGTRLLVELPRNLTCAPCGGGGCDACRRAGAITLRDRNAPGEVVEVTLAERVSDTHSVTMRIPERGGHSGSEALPRGLLLLTLTPSDASDPSVRKAETPTPIPELASLPPRHPNSVIWLAILALWIAVVVWLLARR